MAFITKSGITPLLETLKELEQKGMYIPHTKPYIVPTEEVVKKFHIKKGTWNRGSQMKILSLYQ